MLLPLFSATAKPINLSSAEVMKRNTAIDKQISTDGLDIDDAVAGGNRYFGALSFGLNGTESNHANLHQSIVNHVSQLTATGSSLPGICMNFADVTVRYNNNNNNNNNKHFFNLQVANSPSRLRFEANLSRESSECTEHSQDQTSQVNTGKTVYVGNA